MCVIFSKNYVNRISELMNGVYKYIDADDSLQILLEMLKNCDGSNTYTHSEHVAMYAVLLADSMHLSQDEITKIGFSALFHDIGKLAIPVAILKKPGSLTDEEAEIMKNHAVYGAMLMSKFVDDEDIINAILMHHEKLDGKGYPNALGYEEIPLSAQIITVADIFDALVSRRCYKNRLSMSETFNILHNDELYTINQTLVSKLALILKQDRILSNIPVLIEGIGVDGNELNILYGYIGDTIRAEKKFLENMGLEDALGQYDYVAPEALAERDFIDSLMFSSRNKDTDMTEDGK